MPIEFVLFGLTLAGVAVVHLTRSTVALRGLAVIIGYQLVFSTFPDGRWLRLGSARGRGWLRRIDDLVRLVGGCDCDSIPKRDRSAPGFAMAGTWPSHM
jgi:hypothetical protein